MQSGTQFAKSTYILGNIMLISITYIAHQAKEPYVICIYMILHTVFKMLIDFKKTDCEK